MKLTKIKIEEMANEIVEFLKKNNMISSTSIYYNNKRIRDGVLEEGEFDPHDYFEYAAYDHILSMSFEGELYDLINYDGGKKLNEFEKLLKKYGVYYELGNAWNLSTYLIDYKNGEVEYTYYKKEPDPIHITSWNLDDIPGELKNIVVAWRALQETVGESGSCVIGAGFKFKLNGIKYFMSPCSKFQGSISWEIHKDVIKGMLENLGATEIYYDWGCMD